MSRLLLMAGEDMKTAPATAGQCEGQPLPMDVD
jgi:hypothetical protein